MRFLILGTPWEPRKDELTPTMKLKRRPIAEKYCTEIDKLYPEMPVPDVIGLPNAVWQSCGGYRSAPYRS